MNKYDLISKEILHEIFEYRDGNLYWKNNRSPRVRADKLVGTVSPKGYRLVKLFGCLFRVHRLIYLMFHGHIPKILDHINGDKLDNRIENLREATGSENLRNQKVRSNNKSGVKNVHWHTQSKKWRVSIKADNKLIYFGTYDKLEEAAEVAKQKRIELHKEFARHE